MRLTVLFLSIILACTLGHPLALSDTPDRPLGLLDRIENFGERIFPGKRPAKKTQTANMQTEAGEASSRRAGSAFVDEERSPLTPRPDPVVSGTVPRNSVPTDAPAAGESSTRSSTSPTRSGEPHLAQPVSDSGTKDFGVPTVPPRPTLATVGDEALPSSSRPPLYQRLLDYRQSPFTSNRTLEAPQAAPSQTVIDKSTPGLQPPAQPTEPESPVPTMVNSAQVAPTGQPGRSPATLASQTSTPEGGSPATATVDQAARSLLSSSSGIAPQTVAAQPVEVESAQVRPQRPTVGRSPAAQTPLSVQASVQNMPRVSGNSRDVSSSPIGNVGRTPNGQTSAEERGTGTNSPTLAKSPTPAQSSKDFTSAVPTPARPADHRTVGTVSGVLNGPVLVVDTVGPESITLGKPGSYEIHLKNQGGREANAVRVTVAIPRWAEVVGYEASAGDTTATSDANGTALVWTLPVIGAGKTEKLSLQLIPRESQTIDLAIQYAFAPPRTEAKIEVREPKLQVHVEGPQEVLFGRSEVYRLVISNVGTADAEDVTVAIQPLNKSQKDPITQLLGSLAPGQTRVIELELVARETGKMLLSVDATAVGNVAAHADHEIAIVKPDLSVSLTGPSLQFVGQSDEYVVHVENPGTAPAENVRIQLRYSSALEPVRKALQGARIDGRVISWTIPTLPPGEKQSFQIPCQFLADGEARLMVDGVAEGGLTAQSSLVTVVQAVPNLVLHVEDPGRPLPVGQEGTYRIVVENKGSKAAADVFVVGFFSEGIEPFAAEGSPHKILPGQVVFDKIEQLAPGQKLVLTIRAKAQESGNHIFRAEVRCASSATQLAFETTTHYFDPVLATRPPAAQPSQVR